jgi:transcriptional regulator with XRE-family HTH domain
MRYKKATYKSVNRHNKVGVSLGAVLKSARETKGLSQGEVAKILGYGSPQFISNIERNLAHPPLTIISKLVDLYQLDSKFVLTLMVSQYENKVAQALSLAKSRKSS